MKIRYPDSLGDFYKGVIYQIKDPITKEWSEEKKVSHACTSFLEVVDHLMQSKRIRIVEYDNTN